MTGSKKKGMNNGKAVEEERDKLIQFMCTLWQCSAMLGVTEPEKEKEERISLLQVRRYIYMDGHIGRNGIKIVIEK